MSEANEQQSQHTSQNTVHDQPSATSNTTHHEEHRLPPKLPAYSGLPQIEDPLEEYLGRRAPQLPEKWRVIIAKISPWLTLIALIFGIPFIFAVFGLAFFAAVPAAAMVGYHYGTFAMILAVISIASLVLELIALPGLFHRTKKGWVFVFYAALISVIVSVLSINISGLIGNALGLYILFQVKNQYK